MPQIKIAKTSADITAVKSLFSEYLDVLKTDYGNEIGCASGQEDLCGFPASYLALFLASFEGEAVAACGLKRVNSLNGSSDSSSDGSSDCELGKLYCQPQGRGHGFGRALTQAAIDHARSLGCKRLVLSTEPVMKAAINLYQDMGFVPIEKYDSDQSGCSRFMGLTL